MGRQNPSFGFWGSWPGRDGGRSNGPQLEEKRGEGECEERRGENGKEKEKGGGRSENQGNGENQGMEGREIFNFSVELNFCRLYIILSVFYHFVFFSSSFCGLGAAS